MVVAVDDRTGRVWAHGVQDGRDTFLTLSQQPSRNSAQQVPGSGPGVWVLLGLCPRGRGRVVSEEK